MNSDDSKAKDKRQMTTPQPTALFKLWRVGNALLVLVGYLSTWRATEGFEGRAYSGLTITLEFAIAAIGVLLSWYKTLGWVAFVILLVPLGGLCLCLYAAFNLGAATMGWSLAKGRWVLLALAMGGMAAVIALTTPNPTALSQSLATFHFGYWLTVAGLLSSVLTEIGTHFTHRALLT